MFYIVYGFFIIVGMIKDSTKVGVLLAIAGVATGLDLVAGAAAGLLYPNPYEAATMYTLMAVLIAIGAVITYVAVIMQGEES